MEKNAAINVAVTDPPDPLADIARKLAGHDRVLSTGTFLDGLRFRVHLGTHFGVDPVNVEAQLVGDHGTSQVFLWSSARIAGVPLARLLQERGNMAELRAKVENDVRYANITIIEGHDASHIASVLYQPALPKWCCATSAVRSRSEAIGQNSASRSPCRVWWVATV